MPKAKGFLLLTPKAETARLPGLERSMNTKAPRLVAEAVVEFRMRQSGGG